MKLKLLKQRNSEVQVPNDLRGLGDEPILRASHPVAHLVARGKGIPKSVIPSIQRLGLLQESGQQGHFHFSCVRKIDGEHKEQAVRLFFLMLELHASDPDLKFYLTQIDRLTINLKEGILQQNVNVQEHVLSGWTSSEHCLTLSGPATFHLSQAGFKVQASPTGSKFTAAQLHELVFDLRREAAVPLKRAA